MTLRFNPAIAFIGVTVTAANAWCQPYPAKPIRMVVTLAAGGPTDVAARIIAQKLGEQLGQQVIVDNRPGAGGSVAGEMVVRSPADGYTLFFAANGAYAIAPNFIKLPYDVQQDLAPVALTGVSPSPLWCTRRCPRNRRKS